MNSRLNNLLTAESTKHRNPSNNSQEVLTPKLRQAAANLKNNKAIIIRRADKASTYVILNRIDYIEKLNTILADTTKFRRIKKDPTNKIKSEANGLISIHNSVIGCTKIPKIIGDFKPGYIYGTVKIHKAQNPLRPIISQTPTPLYKLAKYLNNIINPYIPSKFSLKSTNDFLDLLHNQDSTGVLASLDVVSLFTNVPIDQTIDIIIQRAYNHKTIRPPHISQPTLRKLLQLCTKESPFMCPSGDLYLQIEGVAMGSPLGPTFANYYMGHLEETILDIDIQKPKLYGRYVDDIFLLVNNQSEIEHLKQLYEHKSILKFTYELNINNKIPFLDVSVDNSHSRFKTTVYHKPTDQGTCLNYDSFCTDKYKISVINSYLNRAYTTSTTWNDFNSEINQIKQTLINNNYPNTIVDKHINKFINTKFQQNSPDNKFNNINIYYKSQMHSNYKLDERIMKNILYENIRPTSPQNKVKLITYYNNRKTSNLVMRNSTHPLLTNDQKTNLVYSFSCPHNHNQPQIYIGQTTTTLNRRLGSHTYNGSIKQHYINDHDTVPTKSEIINNTKILTHASDKHRLSIKEALLILHSNPIINRQFENFTHTLKLKPNRTISTTHPSNTTVNNSAQGTSPPVLPMPNNLASPQTSIASSNEFNISSANSTNNQPSNILTTPSSGNFDNLYSPTNSHYISPNINERIATLINSTRNSNNSDNITNNTRSPINLRPRSQRIRYLY